MCKHRERESAVEPTITPVRSPSSSPPCDDECFVHPNTTEIAHQHPSTGEINPLPRAPIPPPWAPIHMTHPCPISLFLDLPLPFPHLSITLSSSFSPFDRDFGVNKCFFLIFVWFYFDFCLFEVYILNFSIMKFVWKLRKWLRKCEKLVENSIFRTQPNTRKYFPKHFLECNQTLENIFLSRKYFHLKIFYTRKIFYI